MERNAGLLGRKYTDTVISLISPVCYMVDKNHVPVLLDKRIRLPLSRTPLCGSKGDEFVCLRYCRYIKLNSIQSPSLNTRHPIRPLAMSLFIFFTHYHKEFDTQLPVSRVSGLWRRIGSYHPTWYTPCPMICNINMTKNPSIDALSFDTFDTL